LRPSGSRTVADLHASASRISGLADFGPDDYTDGLSVLLESYSRDAELAPTGNDAGRRWVLKNPSHLFALDALLAVYPDALVRPAGDRGPHTGTPWPTSA
jgi:hypothetical protein